MDKHTKKQILAFSNNLKDRRHALAFTKDELQYLVNDMIAHDIVDPDQDRSDNGGLRIEISVMKHVLKRLGYYKKYYHCSGCENIWMEEDGDWDYITSKAIPSHTPHEKACPGCEE